MLWCFKYQNKCARNSSEQNISWIRIRVSTNFHDRKAESLLLSWYLVNHKKIQQCKRIFDTINAHWIHESSLISTQAYNCVLLRRQSNPIPFECYKCCWFRYYPWQRLPDPKGCEKVFPHGTFNSCVNYSLSRTPGMTLPAIGMSPNQFIPDLSLF